MYGTAFERVLTIIIGTQLLASISGSDGASKDPAGKG